MNEINPLRMAGRLPQYYIGSDPAVSGLVVDGAAVLPPGSELNHPHPAWQLVPQMPVPAGIRSGEIGSGEELAVPVQDSGGDQPARFLQSVILQAPNMQQPYYRHIVGGEPMDYYHYEDWRGIGGDGRVASGNFSDTSVSGFSEKHVETASRGCSSVNSSMGEHPGTRIKLMCSFGGKILPRPGDGRLRYVGGDTRIVSVRRHITFADLMRKMLQLYGQPVTMKYQLPDEDLDALISVSSDEDLENMLEEYERLEAGEGNPRIRSFLFSSAENDSGNLNDSAERKSTDLMFVDAINGLSESRSGKQLDTVSPNTSNNSTGFKTAAEVWNAPLIPESAPAAVMAPAGYQGTASSVMHSLPVGVVSHTKPGLSRIPSAPASAPSSPPVFSQQIRQFPIPDIAHHVSPDQPPSKGAVGQLYEMQRGDGSYHDVEGVGSAASSVNSQQDIAYGVLETRRAVDSPTKAQQETVLAHGNTLDQLHRPELLRTADSAASKPDPQTTLPRPDSQGRMPKVGSHGKLIPLQEQHVEVGAPLFAAENQLPNMTHPPMDLQTFGTQAQLQVPKTAVQHSLEAFREGYHRMDPTQQSAPENVQAQQQALHHRQQYVSQAYPPVGMDPMQQAASERILSQLLPYYRQPVSQFYSPLAIEQLQQSALDSISQQQLLRHRQQYVSQLFAPVGASGQESGAFTQAEQSLQHDDALTGQLPFQSMALQTPVNPPRMGAVSTAVPQLASAPLASGVAFQGTNLKQGGGLQYFPGPGALMDPYGRISMQPNNEQANRILMSNMPLDSHEQRYMDEQAAHDRGAVSYVNSEKKSEESKTDIPLRKHEVLQSQSYYSDELPRPVIPPYPGVNTYQEGLVHYRDPGISRRESNEHTQQREGEEFASRMQYQGGVDWSTQKKYNDNGEMIGGWTQKGQFDTKKDSSTETVSNEILGKSGANTAGLHILQPSFGVAAAVDTHSAVEDTSNQFDSAGRAGMGPSVVAGHIPNRTSTPFSDSSQPTYLPVRVERDGLPMLVKTQQGANALDAASLPSHEAWHGNLVSFGTQQMPDDKAAGLGPPVHTASHLIPPSNVLPSAVLDKMEEGRWTEDLESDRLSAANSGRHSNDGTFETSTNRSLDGAPKRPASGDMIANQEDLLGVSVVSKNCSNKSSTDEGTLAPAYTNMQNMVPNGTSYPIGLNTWGMGLDGFQTNVNVSLPASTSAADVLSPANPSFPLSIDAVAVPSSLAQAGKDSSLGKTNQSRQREERDNTGTINAPSLAPFDPVQVSKGLDDKGFFPIFDSDTLHGSGTAECEEEEVKGNLEHVAKDVAASVLQPAPTLSIQNWQDTLANVETEEKDTKESMLINESLDDVKLHVGEKVVTFQELDAESNIDAEKDEPVVNKAANVAVVAEEDAIAHGLQTVKNSDLEEMRELGSGTFGTVYHGKWRGTDVAIKRIKSSCFIGRPSERERLIADFWREAYILGQLHHPNVVAFYGVVRDGPGGTLATVTEFMVNGSLKQFLQKKDRAMDRRKRFSIIMDAAFGMEYLHGKSIVHFDLKCENLLVNMRDPQRPICKVGDLGLSKVKHQTMVSGGVRGTLPWMAPELLNGSSSLVSEKVDVFSFGIVMWELLTGEEPYANMHYGAIIGGIVSNTLRPTVPSNCDPAWKSLMERCWSAEPEERPSFTEIASELRAMASSTASKGQAQAQPAG